MPIGFEIDSGIALITLNRAEAKNALDTEAYSQLSSAWFDTAVEAVGHGQRYQVRTDVRALDHRHPARAPHRSADRGRHRAGQLLPGCFARHTLRGRKGKWIRP